MLHPVTLELFRLGVDYSGSPPCLVHMMLALLRKISDDSPQIPKYVQLDDRSQIQ